MFSLILPDFSEKCFCFHVVTVLSVHKKFAILVIVSFCLSFKTCIPHHFADKVLVLLGSQTYIALSSATV